MENNEQFAGLNPDEEVLFAGDDDNLVVDLEDVNEDVQYEAIPPGIYDAVVDEVEFTHSQRSGNPMWTWRFRIVGGEYDGRTLFYHTVFTEKGLPRTKRTLVRIAPDIPLRGLKPKEIAESGVLVGRACRLRVRVRPYEGEMRNEVREVLPPAEDANSFLEG